MAIQSVPQDKERLPTVDEIVAETGMPRRAAALHLLLLSGDALVNDREFVPEGQRETILRQEEEAEAALLGAWEEAAKSIDPAASIEENVTRTGLERFLVEAYLRHLRGETPNGNLEPE
jgi:hypothetical protein